MNPRTALILAGVALVVGVVGLIIGISAKNGNKSDQDIADATKAQLEQQLGTTANQVKGQVQAQANQAAGATASLNKQLRGIRSSITQLQTGVNNLTPRPRRRRRTSRTCRTTSTSWTPGATLWSSRKHQTPRAASGRRPFASLARF